MRLSAAFIPLVCLLISCGPKGKETGGTVALDVAAFKGGYGSDFYEKAAEEFSAKHPGLSVTVSADPHIWEKLRPRMVAGTPPDLMFPGWDMDHWALARDGQLMPLDAALDGPAAQGSGTWRSTFDPKILAMCQKDGKTYILPLYIMVYGWWYDPGVFQKHGWTPPKDTDSLLALCEKIKAAGMAPMTFQGQYPYYMEEGMLFPWIVSAGGLSAMSDIQNLKPGAWNSAAVKKAVGLIAQMRDKGYFLEGSVGMTHTEAQTQFLEGKAAMIPCGTWLESEMKKVMPPGANMRFFLPPVVTGGSGDLTAVEIGFEPWMVPAKAKHPQEAIEFFKYMTSLDKAKQFVTEKGTLMAIKGSDQVQLPQTLVEPAAAVRGAKTLWADLWRFYYKAYDKEVQGALTSLLNRQLTPDQFCARCEAAADQARKDESLPKYKVD